MNRNPFRLLNEHGDLRWTPEKIASRIVRETSALGTAVRLERRARKSHSPLIDPTSPFTVSLTSHSDRLGRVHIAIESIGQGLLRPGAIILWIDPSEYSTAVAMPGIRHLMNRGLQVRTGRDGYRAHNKYIHSVRSGDQRTLVTADDDIMYPRTWLRDLGQAFAQGGGQHVAAHWVRLPSVTESGLAPTSKWRDAPDARPRIGAFSLGVCGVVYPVKLCAALAAAGDSFLEVAPLADDVWISWQALKNDIPVRQCNRASLSPLVIPRTQQGRLADHNSLAGGNDRQIEVTYGSHGFTKLRALTSDRRDGEPSPPDRMGPPKGLP